MKKILKKFMSYYFLIFLLLFAELLLILAIQLFLDTWITNIITNSTSSDKVSTTLALIYLLLRFIVFVITVLIFFKIVNKQEDPEFKIPWIVGMLLLPIFFGALFLIFGNHGLRKKDKKIIDSTNKELINFNIKTQNKFHYHLENGHEGAFHYLTKTTNLLPYENNNVAYFKNGETLFLDLISKLKEAQDFIFMEFFIISDGILWSQVSEILKEKAQAGVKVKLLYDDMGCSSTIDSHTPKKLAKYGIECYKFHPFRPILSGLYNNRDHRKIVVIDHKYGYTGGMNLADEYGNIITRFGYWKDTMIRIEGSAINNLIAIFLQNFSLASMVVEDYNKYLDYNYPKYENNGLVMPFGDGPGGIDDALIGEQTYINLLNYAKEEVFISTPYLIPTYSLLDAMRNASLRGVKVHLILPGIPDKKIVYKAAQSYFGYLLASGVDIYLYKPGFNHMKTSLADNKLAVVGTINFDFRSLVHHFECATLLYNTSCMKDIK